MLLVCPEHRGFKFRIPPVTNQRTLTTLSPMPVRAPSKMVSPHEGFVSYILPRGDRLPLLCHDYSPCHLSIFSRYSGS